MTINQIQDGIIREMSELDDWMDKYEYLIQLGKDKPAMDERFMTDDNAMSGCQSSVWIYADLKNGHLHFEAESDSTITKGILVLILRVLNNRPPSDIVKADLYFVEKTGLSTYLSPSRAQGIAAIIRQIKIIAEQKLK